MRAFVLELIVGAVLVLLGIAVVAVFIGGRAWGMDLDLAYGIGALVFSVPAILVLERRRRRQL